MCGIAPIHPNELEGASLGTAVAKLVEYTVGNLDVQCREHDRPSSRCGRPSEGRSIAGLGKAGKAQKVLDQLNGQVKAAEQRLSTLHDEQGSLVKQTKAECKKVRDEAAEGMARVTEKLDMAQKLGNEKILEIDNEVGGKRKELEAVRVELQNLQAKLAAA